MKSRRFRFGCSSAWFASFALAVLGTACSEDAGGTAGPNDPPPASAVLAFVRSADPGEAVGVVAAKAKGAAGHVLVEGRVCEVVKGLAILRLMDTRLDYCGQANKADTCATPWDYCCHSRDDRLANSLLVELRGADGRPLATPSLADLRLCDLVKVSGELLKDEHQNLVLVADGYYRTERPMLPDTVTWPN